MKGKVCNVTLSALYVLLLLSKRETILLPLFLWHFNVFTPPPFPPSSELPVSLRAVWGGERSICLVCSDARGKISLRMFGQPQPLLPFLPQRESRLATAKKTFHASGGGGKFAVVTAANERNPPCQIVVLFLSAS